MSEAIQGFFSALSGENGELVLQAVIFAVVIGAFLSKKGLFSIHTRAVTLGVADRERDIIRLQQRRAKMFLAGLHPFIKDMGREDYDDDLTWRCLDRATLAVYEWITLNHISLDDTYVKAKQEELISLVYSLGVRQQYRTPEFRVKMEEWVRQLLQGLYDIRAHYK